MPDQLPHTPGLFPNLSTAREIYDKIRNLHSDAGKLCRYGSGGTQEEKEEYRMLQASVDATRDEMLRQFGHPSKQYPDCQQCLISSVFGGPSHTPSSLCRSGKRPHCTCDTCF